MSAIMEEMEPGILKMMISDSQAAVNICLAEGGSWRTRHLRLRASHARQRFMTDWVLQHKPGEEMIADIGTKALASNRLGALKEMIDMIRVDQKEEEERREAEIEETKRESRGNPEEVESLLRMVVLMAVVKGAKGQGRRDEGDFGWLWVVVAWAGLMMVVGICATLRWILGRCRGMLGEKREREPEAEPEREVEERRDELRRRRPVFLGSPVPDPSITTSGQPPAEPSQPMQHQQQSGSRGPQRTPERRPESHAGGSSLSRDSTPMSRSVGFKSGRSQWRRWSGVATSTSVSADGIYVG